MFIMSVIAVAAFLIFDLNQRFYKPVADTRSWPELAERTGLIFLPAAGSWSNRSSARVIGKYRGYDLK